MTTGTALVLVSDLSARNTSMPSILGNLRSSKISFGAPSPLFWYFPLQKTKSSASTPSLTQTRLLASFFFFSARMVSSASVGLSSTSRISTYSNPVILPAHGHRKKECSAAVQLGLGPDPASMAGDQPLNDGQSDPGPGKLVDRVQALKYTE